MNIKYAISYFYQIRFFNPTMVPFSTAVWDPKWFHAFQDQSKLFRDKNNVLNGLRCTPLMPGESCDGLCHGRETCATGDPNSCLFLNMYRKQLDALDMNVFLNQVNNIMSQCVPPDTEECTAVFIVHEAPTNPCSERWVLLKWFEDNGIDCKELEYPIKR